MALRIIGKVFIGTGALILLFVAYQLFGTNFVTEREQSQLSRKYANKFTVDHGAIRTEPVEPSASIRPPKPGEGVARIVIPKIGLDWIVVEGVDVIDLKKGPGHYPGTAFPGEKGNTVISGHRTTYGAPFLRVDELNKGDKITVVSEVGTFVYEVTESKIVEPTDLSVVVKSTDARLTLTTCHPRFSAAQRLIIVAELMRSDTGIERAA